MVMSSLVDEICEVVEALPVDQSFALSARHQPITLLWAIGPSGAAIGHLRELPSHQVDRNQLLYHRDHHSTGEWHGPGGDPATPTE
ncbi:hypothetical protein OG689_22460 [Kitasatospora sp. NBC_00240]|uniref:hypothetical protein n=1 Tax=Kitasatospora sp. NBC_00240 TaxID=2903567 RepID=UPI00224D93E8|nr:hypothetical protein [Kitasatospora sp. NBC_00240]MCX5212009.1 hypothetical protein [Kitasatospora sp. NBC_00240]